MSSCTARIRGRSFSVGWVAKCRATSNFIHATSATENYARVRKLQLQVYHRICCTIWALLFFFYFRCRTAGQKSVFGRSCDRPPRHRFFLVSLCLKANAEMVPKIPSCHYMFLMQPSRLKFISNQFHILYTCKITTATGLQPNCSK